MEMEGGMTPNTYKNKFSNFLVFNEIVSLKVSKGLMTSLNSRFEKVG
jgi:hypothetical protein